MRVVLTRQFADVRNFLLDFHLKVGDMIDFWRPSSQISSFGEELTNWIVSFFVRGALD